MPQRKQGPGAAGKPQGGTAVEGAANRVTFIALGLMAVVVVVLVLVSRAGDADESSAQEGDRLPTPRATSAAPPPATTTTPVEDEREVGFSGFEIETNPETERISVLKQVEEGLAGRKLWSTVSADRETGTIMTVSSASCADPRMKDVLTKTGEVLKTAGFVTLRCVEKHGAPVFEIKL